MRHFFFTMWGAFSNNKAGNELANHSLSHADSSKMIDAAKNGGWISFSWNPEPVYVRNGLVTPSDC